MTHTPGPWSADFTKTNGNIGWSIFGNYHLIATVYANYYNSSDADEYTAKRHENANSVANARLIAAAPLLLEACERAMARADDDPNISMDSDYYRQLQAAIRAAKEGTP